MNLKLRDVRDDDLPTLFEHQRDPESVAMAVFRSRERSAFDAHWVKLRADPTVTAKVIDVDNRVAGYIGAFEREGKRFVGYWIARDLWGKGIASNALRSFLEIVDERPLHADVALSNKASVRVLEKCGFVVIERRKTDVDELLFQLR
jgi:RimJ/RimL family protein N-acetyltransferase